MSLINSIIDNFFVGFVLGIILAFWFISRNYKLVKIDNGIVPYETDDDQPFDEEEMDEEYSYYAKLPDGSIIEICVEEPLGVNHRITLNKVWYIIESIDHRVNGHTTFNLKLSE